MSSLSWSRINRRSEPRVLRLNLKGCYFDAIKDGSKTKEYRLTEKWAHRIIAAQYRVGVDQILLLRGYPKNGDESRILRRIWNGYEIHTITHPHFGPTPVRVLAIDVSRPLYLVHNTI